MLKDEADGVTILATDNDVNEQGGWRYFELANGAVHVVPVNDAVDHLSEGCTCGPTDDPVKRDDGSVGWVVIHHSLDGREAAERTSSP